MAENYTSFSLNPYLINTLSYLVQNFLLRPLCLSNLNDMTLAVEDINWIKAGNVNADDSVDVNSDVDVNTEVDVDAYAVGLLCLSDLNDMTLAVPSGYDRILLY